MEADYDVGEYASLDVSRIRDLGALTMGDWPGEVESSDAEEAIIPDTGVVLGSIGLFVVVIVVARGCLKCFCEIKNAPLR